MSEVVQLLPEPDPERDEAIFKKLEERQEIDREARPRI
jgi:hypothetical protein